MIFGKSAFASTAFAANAAAEAVVVPTATGQLCGTVTIYPALMASLALAPALTTNKLTTKAALVGTVAVHECE